MNVFLKDKEEFCVEVFNLYRYYKYVQLLSSSNLKLQHLEAREESGIRRHFVYNFSALRCMIDCMPERTVFDISHAGIKLEQVSNITFIYNVPIHKTPVK